MKKLIFALLACVTLVGCNKENDPPKEIELTGGTSTSQTIYADETKKTDAIKFKAAASWTATVNEVTTRVGGSDVEWLTLNAYEGKAGEQTLTLTLRVNTTGENRKAEIKIVSGGTSITITVEQKSTTESGDKPDSEPISFFITQDGKITGDEIFGDNTPAELSWMIEPMGEVDTEGVVSPNKVPYVNKNFSLTFPTPDANILGGFNSSEASIKPTILPADTKFAGGDVGYKMANAQMSLYLTNISLENLKKGEAYRVKKGEGHVRFVYATKDVVVNGTLNYPGDTQTFKFSNCQFRQGWNEMVMIADADAATNGTVTINVTMNNATSAFKWIAEGYEESGNPNPEPSIIVNSINDMKIVYEDEPRWVFSHLGERSFENDFDPNAKRWIYVSNVTPTIYQRTWRCDFTYNQQGKVDQTSFYYYEVPSYIQKTTHQWDGDKLVAKYNNNYNETNKTGMRIDIEYGDTEYSKGNIDINWLITSSDFSGYFHTPFQSAIGVNIIPYNKLISKIVLTDLNDDKLSATFTYRYTYNTQGYLWCIYKTEVLKIGNSKTEEQLEWVLKY